MSVITVTGVLEENMVKLSQPVPMPNPTPVVVVIETEEVKSVTRNGLRVHRPRLLYPEDAVLLTTDRKSE